MSGIDFEARVSRGEDFVRTNPTMVYEFSAHALSYRKSGGFALMNNQNDALRQLGREIDPEEAMSEASFSMCLARVFAYAQKELGYVCQEKPVEAGDPSALDKIPFAISPPKL